MATVALVAADGLGRYGFPDGHPFGPDRQEAFLRELKASPAFASLKVLPPRSAGREEIELFHDAAYVDLVAERSQDGRGCLDAGDTPAFRGMFEAVSLVVGGTLFILHDRLAPVHPSSTEHHLVRILSQPERLSCNESTLLP